MDTSHLRQLNETPLDSIKKAFPYCNHIHLVNCIVKDKTSNLYGDKHHEFGIEGGGNKHRRTQKYSGNHIKKYTKDLS